MRRRSGNRLSRASPIVCAQCGSSAANPLLTATQGLTIERALKDYMEYTVVSDLFMTPTAQLADLVLPAAHWLEQDDVVFMHKIWCVMTRKKLAQIGEARDDRDVILRGRAPPRP